MRFMSWLLHGWMPRQNRTQPAVSHGYNKIKHDRISNQSAPTLLQAIKAVGALQVVLLHYYRVRFPGGMIADRGIPELMLPWEADSGSGGASTLWEWRLPDDPPAN